MLSYPAFDCVAEVVLSNESFADDVGVGHGRSRLREDVFEWEKLVCSDMEIWH